MFDHPTKWGKILHWAEWQCNTTIHSSTSYTPFEIVYGKPPPTLPQYILGSSNLEVVEYEILDRTELFGSS